MTRSSATNSLVFLSLTCLGLAGCSILKPTGFTPRTFVLTPASATNASTLPASTRSIGLGYVKLPNYLFGRTMAMRQEQHEIVYLENAVWAERLDHALQRVLAGNLATLLPSCQVRLSAWRPNEITDEVYVTLEQFDVDDAGTCTLNAWWRIVPPGGGQARSSGHFQERRSGPAPDTDPDGAVASMSALAAELSRTIAHGLDAADPSNTGSAQ